MIIDGITLDYEMYWENEYQWEPLISKADRCIDGSLIVQSRPQYAGRSISLVGENDRGWQKKSTVDLLRASYSILHRTFVFSYNGVDYDVRWHTEEGDSCCSFQMIVASIEPSSEFWYYGTIKLITID